MSLANPDLNELVNASWKIYNSIEDGEQKMFYSPRIRELIRRSRLATEDFWIPTIHEDLDKMVFEFTKKDIGMGAIALDSVLSFLKKLEINPKPESTRIISLIRSENSAAESRETESELPEVIAKIENFLKSDFTEYDFGRLYDHISSSGSVLRGYDEEFKFYTNFMRMVESDTRLTKEERIETARESELLSCQEYEGSRF